MRWLFPGIWRGMRDARAHHGQGRVSTGAANTCNELGACYALVTGIFWLGFCSWVAIRISSIPSL